MKYLCLQVCCLLILTLSSWAQNPAVQLSPAFTVPADGWDKLLQLKNGNTCYLHFSKKEGIYVTVYDTGGQALHRDTVTGQQWDARNMNDTEIDGIFDINGQPVIFLQQLIKGQPTLFRIILDAQTGTLLREDLLGTLTPVPGKEASSAGYIASHDCYVEKDTYSDHYAVAFYGAGVRLQHYAPDHTSIGNTSWTIPDSSYRYTSFLGMTVQGNERISLLNGIFNTSRKVTDTPPVIYLSTWQQGQTDIIQTRLDHTAGLTEVHTSMQYHPEWPELEMLLVAAIPGKTDSVQLQMQYLDRATGKLLRQQILRQQQPAYGTMYNALPQQLTLQRDGKATLLLEPMQQFLQGKNAYSRIHTNLGDAGIWRINPRGDTDSIRLSPKMQIANGGFSPLYIQRRNKGEWIFRNRIAAVHNTAYMSFEHIPVPGADYVLYNDYLQQLDRGGIEDAKKPLRYITDANLVCYKYTPGGSERLFLFGTPEYGKGYYCILGAAHYNAANQVYATIMISRQGTTQQAQLAWIRF
ncbi:hypothetical protein KTO58_10100 [Chitinophaga pendula]|uniref:hypothetical protein n=1 Tax=Chitinophaga TaxID=79328 RepID=UPI000BB089F3|nr:MULTISPECIES: hypothetical protein [Chitinophaga]ASZ12858.1 hypothetical protein CK934_18795 [Chitinophaga sp. MD30]UCJ09515.1 hypothetical protein KTO58_10100 [Chitinophaga pendula]